MRIRKKYLKKWQSIKPEFWKNEERAKVIQNKLQELLTKEIELLKKLLKKEETVREREMVKKIIEGWRDGEYLGVYNPDKDEWRFMNDHLAKLMISLLEKYLTDLGETT